MADFHCRIAFMTWRAESPADRNLKLGDRQEIIKKTLNPLQFSVCICAYMQACTCTYLDDLWGFHTKLNIFRCRSSVLISFSAIWRVRSKVDPKSALGIFPKCEVR